MLDLNTIETQANAGTLANHEWREQPNHQSETQAVKRELATNGINAKVTHGRGTGYGWLHITFNIPTPLDCTCGKEWPMCNPCASAYHEAESKAMRIALRVTGRAGDYDGRILVQANRV